MKCIECGKEIKKGTTCPECIYRARWEREKPALINSLFPPRIVDDLNKLIIKVSLEDVLTIIDDGKGLFLFGDTGTGKTIYAASLLLEVIKKRKLEYKSTISGKYTGGSEFFQEIRETMNNSEISSSDVLQKYEEADILILDEIGTEKPSDWVFQMFYLLMNHRYEYLKPTIIVSNFGLMELTERLNDDRIPSRIEAMCKSKCFKGLDYRIRENNNG